MTICFGLKGPSSGHHYNNFHTKTIFMQFDTVFFIHCNNSCRTYGIVTYGIVTYGIVTYGIVTYGIVTYGILYCEHKHIVFGLILKVFVTAV